MANQIGQLVHMVFYGQRRAATLEKWEGRGMALIRFTDTGRAQWAHAESVETGGAWGDESIWAYESLAGLVICASGTGREDLADSSDRESDVMEALCGNGLEFVPPEMLGLTEMPAFSCGLTWECESSDTRAWDGEGRPVYGFPDYMTKCQWDELQREGRVIFLKVAES